VGGPGQRGASPVRSASGEIEAGGIPTRNPIRFATCSVPRQERRQWPHGGAFADGDAVGGDEVAVDVVVVVWVGVADPDAAAAALGEAACPAVGEWAGVEGLAGALLDHDAADGGVGAAGGGFDRDYVVVVAHGRGFGLEGVDSVGLPRENVWLKAVAGGCVGMSEHSDYGIAAVWVAVAVLVGVTMQGVDVVSVGGVVRVVAMLLALFLAVVYAFDPLGVLAKRPF
jgi:hypothetical protein